MRAVVITNEMRGKGLAEEVQVQEVETYQTFAEAVASVSTDVPIILEIERIEDVTANVTVADNIKLRFTRRGRVRIATGVTITVESPEHIIAEQRDYIFESPGAVAFNEGGTVYPGWWGALGDGVNDDLAAITAALASLPQHGRIYFPRGIYGISEPIHPTQSYRLEGDQATILALAGFTAEIVDVFGGGTIDLDCLVIFLDGLYGHSAGSRHWHAHIGPGLFLDCNDIADTSLYIERFPYSYLNFMSDNSNGTGVILGRYCWGTYIDSLTVENFTDIGLQLQTASNGVQITNPKIWGHDKTGGTGIEFVENAVSSGVIISGGFIEKVDYGVKVLSRNGPIAIIGVDFEVITNNCLYMLGDLSDPSGRLIGPARLEQCYLDATGSKVYVDRGRAIVTGCRLRAGNDFETHGSNQSCIYAYGNEYNTSGVPTVVAGSAVITDKQALQNRIIDNFMPKKDSGWDPGYNMRNYQFRDDPDLQSSGFNFKSSYQGGGTLRYLSIGEWWISEYRHASPGSLYKTVGVKLNNQTGQSAFSPWEDNTHSLGEAALRWLIGYLTELVLGKDGDTRGQATFWDGSGGNQPGCYSLCSPNGTRWYFFVEDDGTFKVHNALPTQNADGTVVGTQT